MEAAPYDARERLILPIDRLEAETKHLSAEQFGAFMLLLGYAWTHDGVLPAGDRELARICKASRSQWCNAKPLVMPFFRDGLPAWLACDAEESGS